MGLPHTYSLRRKGKLCYCTKRKATAVGLLFAVCRVASIVAQVVNASLSKSPPLLVAVTASLMALGAASVFALPSPEVVEVAAGDAARGEPIV